MRSDKQAAEKPKIPFNIIYRDLDRAMNGVEEFSKCERIILLTARELSYAKARIRGLDNPIPFTINQMDLVRRFKCTQKNINTAFRRLIQAEILIRDDDGKLSINKRYETWREPHKLTFDEIRLCRAAFKDLEFGE